MISAVSIAAFYLLLNLSYLYRQSLRVLGLIVYDVDDVIERREMKFKGLFYLLWDLQGKRLYLFLGDYLII